ncbi:MAG: hypothetical protein OXC28_15985 [Defluviicoccus sp.]|nr:hypothetical protein [Defluviicoccus sp.]
MAQGSASVAGWISALIAEIEAEAYARGQADARNEVLKALGAAEGSKRRAEAARGGRPAKARRRAGGRKRAPRGSVRRLVERVLGDHPGSTAPEIAGRAADHVERSVKLASIRVELRNGLAQQRYVSDNGRWSLAGASGEDAVPEAADTPRGEEAATGGEEDGGRLGLSW